jgi:malonate transporter and related proteins
MTILDAIFPIIIVAGLGYAARRFNVFSEAETSALERVAFWYLLPCLLFYGTATAEFPETIDWRYLGGFYLVTFTVYAAGMLTGRVLFGYSLRELSVFGMAGTYANVTILGIPITLQVLGDAALVPMLLVITVHNLVLYTLGTLLAELQVESGSSLRSHLLRIGWEMLRNPISGSLLLGAAWNIAGFNFPGIIAATFELIRPAAIPAALFALGAGMHRYRIRGEINAALVITLTKLLVQPLLMWWVLRYLLDVDPYWAKTGVMLAAMPVGISVYVFSRRYQSCETATATAIVLSSLGGIASISFLVWLMDL